MTKPISPREACAAFTSSIPDEVFEAFNELLAERSKIGEAIDRVLAKLNRGVVLKATRQMLFDRHWLDIEAAYRDAGWTVEYDRPGYCENYEAFWTFRARRKDGAT